jgi:hypothetical protein
MQEIRVFNAMGQMVKKVPVHYEENLQIDMSNQSAGVYLLQAVGEGNAFTARFMKE